MQIDVLIDVSYRYRRDELKGGRMLLDPETGAVTHVLPEPEFQPEPAPAVVRTRAAKNAKA